MHTWGRSAMYLAHCRMSRIASMLVSGNAALHANSDRHLMASWNESMTARKYLSKMLAVHRQQDFAHITEHTENCCSIRYKFSLHNIYRRQKTYRWFFQLSGTPAQQSLHRDQKQPDGKHWICFSSQNECCVRESSPFEQRSVQPYHVLLATWRRKISMSNSIYTH